MTYYNPVLIDLEVISSVLKFGMGDATAYYNPKSKTICLWNGQRPSVLQSQTTKVERNMIINSCYFLKKSEF